jgi:hypothetical protein
MQHARDWRYRRLLAAVLSCGTFACADKEDRYASAGGLGFNERPSTSADRSAATITLRSAGCYRLTRMGSDEDAVKRALWPAAPTFFQLDSTPLRDGEFKARSDRPDLRAWWSVSANGDTLVIHATADAQEWYVYRLAQQTGGKYSGVLGGGRDQAPPPSGTYEAERASCGSASRKRT